MTAVQNAGPQTAGTTPALSSTEPGRRRRLRGRNPVFWIVMVLITLVFLAPLAYMLLTSVKTTAEARSVPPTLLPGEPTLQAFRTLFFADQASPVLRWLVNSLLAATLHSLLVVVISAMAGYALARMQFPGKKALFGVIIATLFLPAFVFMMPNFEILNRLDWLDRIWAIVVPGAAGAFGVFFMRQFFSTIPIALEESARIDGAGPWRTFVSIVLPNARPAIVTLPVGLTKLQGAYTIDYPVIMAGAALASVPVLLLYIFVQRYVIEGVASSGIKG
jgi:multiple sugar transport system permease protein